MPLTHLTNDIKLTIRILTCKKSLETTKAIRKLSKYKEGVSVETPIFVPLDIVMFYKLIYVNL